MASIPNKSTYNPTDYYLLVFKEDGKVYEKYRTHWAAQQSLVRHPLKDYLEITKNPKYKND